MRRRSRGKRQVGFFVEQLVRELVRGRILFIQLFFIFQLVISRVPGNG